MRLSEAGEEATMSLRLSEAGEEAQAMRLLIVQDETTQWFVRSLVCSIMDATKRPAEMRYVCDKHLGGPFASLDEVVAFVEGRR
jgi:hypothetical protein